VGAQTWITKTIERFLLLRVGFATGNAENHEKQSNEISQNIIQVTTIHKG